MGYLGTPFDNAPWVKVNNGTELFSSTSGINATTLYDLLLYVNKQQVWGNSTTKLYKTETSANNLAISLEQEAYFLSAKNFGKLNGGTTSSSAAGNTQLMVKLFNGATLGEIDETLSYSSNINVDKAATVLWQAVYRSMDSTKDVLTLLMNDSFCASDRDYPSSLYYKESCLRRVVQKTYAKLIEEGKYPMLDNYTVLPQNIPGKWQSNTYQTGSDRNDKSYTGASSMGNSISVDAVNNGLDTSGTLPSNWTTSSQTTNPYISDKLWVPSNYEATYKDSSTDGLISYVSAYYNASATLQNGTAGGSDRVNDGRSGLWELNGYDRVIGAWTWLRAAQSLGRGEYGGIDDEGALGELDIDHSWDVRAALHLDLGKLANATLSKVVANVSAPDDAPNITATISGSNESRQTSKPTFSYINYIIPNSSDTIKGKRTITFGAIDTTQYKVSSFKLQQGTTTQTIDVSSASGSGNKSDTGVCDYSYTYSNGQLVVSVGNAGSTGELNVQANIEVAFTDMTLNLKVTNSAPNSLLVLTFLNGNTKLGKRGFVYYSGGQQTATITLPFNATIKILATKPFGSRAEFVLDDTPLTSSNSVCYEIQTGTTASAILTITLTNSGIGGWNNAIVI